MSNEDCERIITAEAAVANEKKSMALAYVFAIFLGGAGAHNFYLGRPLHGAFNLTLLVFSFVPHIGVLFLVINAILVVKDLFLIPSIIREQVEEIRARFLPRPVEVAQEPRGVDKEIGGFGDFLARHGFAVFLIGSLLIGLLLRGVSDQKSMQSASQQPLSSLTLPDAVPLEKAADQKVEPAMPVVVDEPIEPATKTSPPPSPTVEAPRPSPVSRKGSKRKGGRKVKMGPQ